MLDKVRKCFDINSGGGWFLPLIIPIALWWFLIQGALQETGLKGEIRSKVNTIAIISEYTDDVNTYPGEPIISVLIKRNGNREVRLVVRTMSEEGVINDIFVPFIFPALMSVLFGLWCCSIIIKFKTPASDPWRKPIVELLMWSNIFAIVYFFGTSGIGQLISILKLISFLE